MSIIKINKLNNIYHIIIDNFYENYILYKNINYYSFLTFSNNNCFLYNFRNYNDLNFKNENNLNYLLICNSSLLNYDIKKNFKLNLLNNILDNCFYYFFLNKKFNLISYDSILEENIINLNYNINNKNIQLKTNNTFFNIINNIYFNINYVKKNLKKDKIFNNKVKYNFNYIKFKNFKNNLYGDKKFSDNLIINIKNNIKDNFINIKINYLKSSNQINNINFINYPSKINNLLIESFEFSKEKNYNIKYIKKLLNEIKNKNNIIKNNYYKNYNIKLKIFTNKIKLSNTFNNLKKDQIDYYDYINNFKVNVKNNFYKNKKKYLLKIKNYNTKNFDFNIIIKSNNNSLINERNIKYDFLNNFKFKLKNLHKNNNNIFFKKNNELQIKKYNFTVKLNNNSKNILIEKYNIDTIDLYNQKINKIFFLFIKKINNYNSSYKKVIDKLLDLNFNINIIDYNKIIHKNKFNYYNLIIFNIDNINNYITNKKHTKLLFDNIKYFWLFVQKNINLNNLIFK